MLDQLKLNEIDISPKHKEQLKDLLIEYSHVFSKNRFDLGKATFFEAEMNLKKDYIAKWVPSRPISYKLKPDMDQEIHSLIESGQIERCNYSRWNSCVFLVGKPDGKSYRLVQDMRQLNTQTLPDNFPLPRMDTIMDKMVECNYLSKFDFVKGFVQIGLEEKSRPLTAFTYDDNRYQWNRLPMGQTNSSSQFARCMATLFQNVPFQALICYLDDILVGSRTVEEHLKRLRFIFDRLSWGGLKLSPNKTKLFKREVKFLGNLISNKGLRVDQDRIKAIQELKEPNNVKQLQKFLGVMNYNRSFVKNFAKIAAPLYNLLQKNVSYTWNDECQESFDKLKECMTKAPTLSLPDVTDPLNSYILTIDSSKQGHAAVLTQIVNGKRRIISYFSKGVPAHLKKLGATRLEFLGLYHALKHYRLYLENTFFIVRSDCLALTNLDTLFKNENSYYQRRLAELSGFKFKIEHISGKSAQIQMADFLSRYPFEKSSKNTSSQTDSGSRCDVICTTQPFKNKTGKSEGTQTECSVELQYGNCHLTGTSTHDRSDVTNKHIQIKNVLLAQEAKSTDPVTIQEIKEEYQYDRNLSTVIEWLQSGNVPDSISYRKVPAQLCHYWQHYNLLKFENGILYRKWVDPNDRSKDHDQIVVPCTLIERILYTYHDASCHGGVETALELCRRKFYYKMKKEYKLYCSACVTCAKSKQAQKISVAPLKPIVYSHFGQCISIDYNEPSKKPTKRGHTALLTIVDMYSNYLVCVPVKSTGTEEAIRIIINEWILKYGCPLSILHDLGASFTSDLFKAVMKIFDIRDTHGVAWHSQTQGRVESFNKKINVAMRVSLGDEEWQEYDKYINFIVYTLNSLKSTKTGFSAHYLVFGRELAMPRDIFLVDNDRTDKIRSEISDTDYKKLQAYNLYKQIADITRKVVQNSDTKAKYMKCNYDKHRSKGPFFEKNDLCLLAVNVPKHKFANRFHGPYLIVDKLNDHNYIVNIDGVNKVVNISKMKAYKPNHYSQVTAESLKNEIAANKQATGNSIAQGAQKPKTASRNVTELPRRQWSDSSDSSSDDGDYIILTRARTKKRAEKSNRSSGMEQHSDGVEIGECALSANQQTERAMTNDQNTITAASPGLNQSIRNQNSDLDQTFDSCISYSDQELRDDTETQNEADQSGQAPGNTENLQLTFTEINGRDINMSDIERHETRVVPRPTTNTNTGSLTRSTTMPNIASSSRTQDVDSRSNSSNYNLRRNPAKTKFFGLSSPFKKSTKKK